MLGDTWFFYGGYETNAGSYRMGVAYVSVLVITFLFTFVVLLLSIGRVGVKSSRGGVVGFGLLTSRPPTPRPWCRHRRVG